MNYDDMIAKLENGDEFSFARYGDGEWLCMMGKKGRNIDKHPFSPALAKDLLLSVQKPKPYTYGLQPLSRRTPNIMEFVKKNSKVDGWVNADIIHTASKNGGLSRLLAIDATIVGPAHMSKLGKTLIEVPRVDCYSKMNDTLSAMQRSASKVFFLCASMMSEVIIYRLFNTGITMIDVGSAFDPYCGVKSRTYHSLIK